MDENLKGMIIFGLALTASVVFLAVRHLRARRGLNDLRPTDADPRARAVVSQLRDGAPTALIDLLQSLGQDWDARAYYLNHLVSFCNRESLDALCAQKPSPLAFLVRGCHAIDWAWQARGSGSAASVSARAWQIFDERLQMAEHDLLAAAQGDPADPTPYAKLITIAKASNVPREIVWDYFNAAIQRQPDNFFAHDAMLSFLSRRWKGSDQEMFDFARRRCLEAPPGSDLPMLVLAAHLDVWSHIHTFDGDEQRALGYLSQPDVLQEVHQAYMRTLAGPSRVRMTTIHYRNDAAFFFFLTQNVQYARTELEKIGGGLTEYPWVYFRRDGQETRDVVTMAKMVAGLR